MSVKMTGEEVREMRLKMGVTQETFARMIGAGAVTVNRWENGVAKPSRLYVDLIRALRGANGSYICRREEP